MSLYTNEDGAPYLCSFRSADQLEGDAIGSLFRFYPERIQLFRRLIRMATASAVFACLFILLLALAGIDLADSDSSLLLLGIIGIAPFALLLTGFLACSSAPRAIILRDARLQLSDRETSRHLQLALTFTSLSLALLFLYVCFFIDPATSSDRAALGGLALFWLFFTLFRLHHLRRLLSGSPRTDPHSRVK